MTARRTRKPSRATRLAALRKSVLVGLAVTLVLSLASLAVEHTRPLVALRLLVYDLIHAGLSARGDSVVVIDITDIANELDAHGRALTSRKALREVLDAVVECAPRSVGLDIDLSPDVGTPLPADDVAFLEACQRAGAGGATTPPVPVFVGVDRTRDHVSAEWLGDARFQDLAATLVLDRRDNRALPIAYQSASATPLPGLGFAIARAHSPERVTRERYPAWIANSILPEFEDRVEAGVRVTNALVDYSAVEKLAAERVLGATNAAAIRAQASRIRGRAALIGYAHPDRARDNAIVIPGSRRSYPGIYGHAAAAVTLLEGKLYEPSHLVAALADLAMVAGVLLLVGAIRWYALAHRGVDVRERRLHLLLVLVASGLVVVAAIPAAAATRIIWSGSITVIAALWIEFWREPLVHAARGLWSDHVVEKK